jgi:inner membrane protease ATP23
MTPERCAKELDEALGRSSVVKFMVDALAKAGCPVGRSFFSVETCDQKVVGGFRPGDGVRVPLSGLC